MITDAGIKIMTAHGAGRVEQTIDIAGQVRREVVDVAALQLEAAARAELIALGWTPPGESRESFLPIDKVTARVGLGKTAIYAMVNDGTFPAPIKFGARSLWVESEIVAWLQEQAASAPRMGRSMGARRG